MYTLCAELHVILRKHIIVVVLQTKIIALALFIVYTILPILIGLCYVIITAIKCKIIMIKSASHIYDQREISINAHKCLVYWNASLELLRSLVI